MYSSSTRVSREPSSWKNRASLLNMECAPIALAFGLLHVSDVIEILKEASSFLHLRIDPIVSRFGLLGCCSSSRYHWWVHSSMVKMQRSSRPVLPSASATNHRRSQVRSVSESTGVLSGLFMHAHAPTPSPWLARCRTAVERVCWLVTPVHPNAVEQVGGATIHHKFAAGKSLLCSISTIYHQFQRSSRVTLFV